MASSALTELFRAVAAGEIPEDDFAGGYGVLEVEPPNGPGEVFEVENPDYPYVYVYQVVRRMPGVARCVWRRGWTLRGERAWSKYMPPRFLCRLVDTRRTD